MTDLSDRIAGLSAEKRALLARMLRSREREAEPAQLPAISRRPDRGTWPLSYAQERFWFLQRYAPESAFYNDVTPFRLLGPLHLPALHGAFDTILGRHEILRARFSEVDGRPVQAISPAPPPYFATVDLSALPEARRQRETPRLVAAEAEHPFDLTRGPLLRTVLLRISAEDHLLLLSMHHIVTDGWSWVLLLRELSALYGAFREGRPAPLPDLPIQYADFAAWQRQWLGPEILEAQLSYWRDALRDLPGALVLPLDRPRSPAPALRGASEAFAWPPASLVRVEACGRRPGVTLFMVLLAVFQSLLARYTDQDDIVVGTPIAGRNHPATHDLIGVFINMLALRARVEDGSTFLDLLERVRQATIEAFGRQDLPFDQLVKALRPDRGGGHQPLFQVLFAVQHEEEVGGPVVLPGLRLAPAPMESRTAKYDWSLSLTTGAGGIQGWLEYDADLFDRTTVRRFLACFGRWLEAVAEEPGRRLSEVPLLGEVERQQLVREWSGSPQHVPELCLHDLLDLRAQEVPDAVAVVGEDGLYLSYGGLHARARRLAWRLRRSAVGPEVPVAVSLERSPELIIAMVAIWQAGGIYLPLDPSHPPERRALVLEDAGARVVLEGAALSLTGAPDVPADYPPPRWPEALAWIIYTSGSTGRPKGVGVEHGRACAHLASIAALYGIGRRDRILAFSSPSFDVSLENFLLPLTSGATLVLRGAALWQPAELLDRVHELQLTTIDLPTAYFHQWLGHAATPEPALPLRLLLVGGEALPAEAEQLWSRRALPGVRLVNSYGPTEAIVTATAGEVGSEPGGIGRPAAGRSAYVLDRCGGLVPVGATGELCLGGPLLARGYLGRPDLTAERFVPDPFAAEWGSGPGSRLYRTGDLVRRLAGGAPVFLGRIDDQVKVRGFRIELGEIEEVLRQHPQVNEGVVAVREHAGGDRRLWAYVAGAGSLAPEDLREFVERKLPAHMVPSGFMVLPALPRTPNGKVDRRALPEPPMDRTFSSAAARTPAEELIAQIWAEILGAEQVGMEESFFELGGHSLLATRVMSRLRTTLGVELPLRALFEAPTVARLASRVEAALRGGAAVAPPIPRADRTRPLPLSFAQRRLWFLHQMEPRSTAYNLPVPLHLRGGLDEAALAACFCEIVRRHEALRTTFAVEDGRPVQRIGAPAGWLLPVADLTALPPAACEAEARRLVREEASLPFDLAAGPLLRSRLLRLSGKDRVLLLDMHHIVSDGWSMGVLVREAAALYEAAVHGGVSPLAELPIQYADFALWQQEWLSGEVLERQLGYWRRHLAGAPPAIELPTDRPRPPVQSRRGARGIQAFPASLAAGLRALARQEGATSFMLLLAGFAAVLCRYAGQDRLVVGTPIANRTRAEVEPLIGFFVNTLPLHLDLAGDPSLRELLVRVRGVTLDAYAHQDVPFEKLVEELQPERHMSRQPLFQVVLALQNTPTGTTAFPGLSVRQIPPPEVTSKFDLSLFVEEEEDGLVTLAEHDLDLFDRTTVQRLLGHFGRWLVAAAATPEQRLSEVSLWGPAERHQVLREWNATAQVEAWGTLPELFAAQAARVPDGIALDFESEAVSYGELARRARLLGRSLRRLGVGPETRVGLFLERSVEMVVGVLGTLEAGGAYVPLDPSYPQERLSFMLQDAQVPVLVTQQHLEPSLPESAARVVRLDADWERIGREPEEGPPDDLCPTNVVYVIYTSGSTGRPKGVLVTHRGLCNLVQEQTRSFALGPGDRVLQFHSLSFDMSIWDIVVALGVGATLVLAPRERLLPGSPLAELLLERQVTQATLLPSVLASLPAEELRALHTVMSGAEPCPLELARRWSPGRTFFNGYGPTEATIELIQWVYDGMERRPPIGRPIRNARAYVVDAHQQPVPVGVAGELCLGGAPLARGYLGRPETTAEKFIPDGFGDVPGSRLYRTGDLVRHWPDGNLDFLGRIDSQVKVRGYRIELGEIESVLKGHAGVGEAVVVVREDRPGDRRLVGYVVPREREAPGTGELREHVGAKLPEHMVPSAFVVLDALPLAPNHKVDRRALPAPDRDADGPRLVAPRTPVEELLAAIWAEVLGVERVGVEESFFAAGGHSLLATRVMSRLRTTFGVELPLRALFEEPTLARLASRVEAALRGCATTASSIPRTDRNGPLPLSFAQERLWFLDQLEPGSARYNIPAVMRLVGLLEVSVFAAVLDEIVRRHEVLRTTFAFAGQSPVQLIAPVGGGRLAMTDLSGLPAEERQTEALRLASEEALRPFDLGAGPLLRMNLLRLGAEEHVVLANMHHIVSDGWSAGVLIRELGALYGAFAAGLPSPLPELPIQYADFAFWQRGWLTGEVLETQLAWWRQRLAGAPPLLELPTDRPRPAALSSRGGRVEVHLPAGPLAALGRRQGTTLFMTVLGLFQVLLGRHAGSEDVVAGSPIAGRTRSELEPLVGFFVNPLALRADLSGSPSVRELLAQVRETALGAYAHQDIPFEKLVEELAPERHLGRTPLFQVMLTLQNTPEEALEVQGLRLAGFPLPAPPVKFDLTLTLAETAFGLEGVLDYSADLFDSVTAARLVERFGVLAEAGAADPERPVTDLPMLPEAERHHLLREHNDTAAVSADETLHALFEAQAARTPDAVAVVFEEQCLTYGELERRANRLARRLQRLGVGPESRVGLCLERSIELVMALLAVQKAGGAYVPLDPALPGERLSYLVEDSASAPVITESRFLERLPAGDRYLLERAWKSIVREDDAPLGAMMSPDQSTYVLYTSGSTGRPKGVVVPHRGVVNHMRWIQRELPLQTGDRLLQKTPLVFDASVWELYAPLFAGATLVMAHPGGHQDPAYLMETMERHEITVFQGVPTLLSLLAEEPGFDRCRSLRYLVSGGEVLSWELVERLRRRHDAEMFNLYGPTEASIDATGGRVPLEAEGSGRTVGLGRPLPNTRVHLLDRSLRLVPVGAVGEICLGGVGLARGYQGRPELTAERFVPDPWSEGDRLYRTGDLARRRSDGELEYLGRADSQVKLRGQRLELAEIEAMLAGRPEVQGTVVVVREDHGGDRRLVAYVVPAEGARPEPQVLRGALRGHLPEFMVPAVFVVLDALPLLPSGKVDRKALPAPETTRPAGEVTAPRTPVEELLAGIWAEVLGRERVGVEENFFELGGHSLLATRVISRVRDVLGISLPLRTLFEAPTIAGLARRVELQERSARTQPFPPADRSRPLPLSFAQERLWFLDQLEPGSARYNIPAVMRLVGRLEVSVLAAALDEIVRRHEALRTTFAFAGQLPVQVIAPVGRGRLAVPDLSGLPAVERQGEALRLAQEEAFRPFDLAAGPLLRVSLLRLGSEEHVMLANMHHIVSDGWSAGVLIRELAALYGAFAAGLPSPLPELPIQFADFAVWQRGWLTGEVLETQLAWWRERLAGAPPLLDLPTDRPRPASLSARGGSVEVHLPGGALAILGRRQGTTLFMTVLGLFQVLLGRHAGSEDVVVGSPIAGRTRSELEPLVGFFVNTLALRADLTGSPSVGELLAQVRETALGAYAHQDVPFEKLVEELAPERHLGRTPLFQVMLVLQNTPEEILELPGLRLEGFPLPAPPVKFDLTLTLSEAAGGLDGVLGYSADLFDAVTAARLVERFRVLAEAAVAAPDRRVIYLPMLAEAERHQLAVEWSAGLEVGREMPGAGPLAHELFREQARRKPDAIAVTDAIQSLSFAELDRRSVRLAGRLRGSGVGPEVRVALCATPSAEALAGLLAIFKAGGVWVSLDPSAPRQRLAGLLEDCGAVLLLTQERLSEALPPLPVRRLDLDGEETAAATGTPFAAPALGRDNAAYVIYTSGSTGRPKGVLVTHGSLSNYLRWSFSGLHGLVDHPVPLVSSMSFDGSLKQFLTPLMHGETVWVPRGGAADPEALLDEMAGRGSVALSCVPSLWKALLGSLEAAAGQLVPRLECLVLGGEPIDAALVDRTLAVLPGVEILNVYGPTEATVNASLCGVRAGGAAVPTLGRPVAGAVLYVLDRWLQPQPIGAAGELVIGGPGLARGYLQRPDLTAGRFLPDPFGGPGNRLYRTGDLVRFRRDGEIEFLGRIDHQVKVRGYRVEPGEIEAALAACPGVREAAVLARESRAGDVILAAYVVARPGTGLAPRELRQSLLQRLPEYMVPAAFVVLDALPLLPGGKVDRRALPEPETVPETAGTEPRTPVEELLAGIWAEVLARDRVGVEDNFFELGGHSLLATRVVSRIRSVLAASVPLRALFETPTVAGLARRIEPLERGAAAQPIPPADRSLPLPLSFAQERLWLLDQLEAGSSRYNIPAVVRLVGRLDVSVFAAALDEIVRRHEVLRTTFALADQSTVQVIDPAGRGRMAVTDLTGLSAAERDTEALRLAQAEVLRPFDLAAGPLLRLILLRLDAEDHVVVINVHHVVFDGWSMGVFFKELGALYEALAGGGTSPLPELPIQYADFAVWQRQWLGGGALERQLTWWREHLAGAPAVLELPADRPRPALQGLRGGNLPVRLPAALGRSLAALSRREGATLFMTLLGLFQALLGRHAGADDLVVGSPIAGRTRSEVEPLIGFFVNTLALRSNLEGDPTVRELLARVRETALGAYAHQDVPFEKLVEELAPERDLSRTPLFQVMFALQNVPAVGAGVSLSGLELRQWAARSRTAKFDLSLALSEAGEELAGEVEYDAGLFDVTTVMRLLQRFQVLLEAAVAEPERRIADLPLLSEAERHFLLAWNDTAVARPEICLHWPIQEQARCQPDRIALVFEGQALSYGVLEERANRLAHRLRELGVGPEVPVGVCLERSPALVVALLAVLKAGGAYLPLDPELPAERAAWMLEDGGARVLLRDLLEEPEPCPATPPDSDVGPENLAYVIFTSGSTGRPKGVMNRHGAVANRMLWMGEAYGVAAGDRVLQKTPFSFDVSVWDLFWPLMNGLCLVMARPGGHRDSAYLVETLVSEQITWVHFVPSMLGAFLQEAGVERCTALRRVSASGEALPPDLAERFSQRLGAELLNLYGPTEAAIEVSHWLYAAGHRTVPIGRPIANVALHILDRRMRPVPVGVPGELHIGGLAVARGYSRRADLTAGAFLPDPFSGTAGGRLYATGDRARWLPEGTIEYLGRLDHQVKVRGYRIELGEIEAALAVAPQVRESAVVARQGPSGSLRLVAYVVTASAAEAAELAASLGRYLPSYMVPSAFVELDALPRTPSGKVDRKALPAPEAMPLAGGTTAPRTPVEELLAGIWAEVLGFDHVGVEDNFFELGGHSLLATRVVSRVRDLLGTSLPLRALFEAPTISGLARRIELQEHGAWAQPIPPSDRSLPLPLSFAQERLWFLDQLEPGSARYNIPVVVRLLGRLEVSVFAAVLDEIVRRHEVLRTTFAFGGQSPVQVIAPAGPSGGGWLAVTDLSGLPAVERQTVALRLAQEEALRPFDLSTGPLLRVSLLRLGIEEHVVLANMHHIVSDGWSAGVLIRELATLYGAFAAGLPSSLPELRVQYADFAVWQRDWLTGEVLETQLAWWRQRLAGAPPLLELPTDRPRPATLSTRGGRVEVHLPGEVLTTLGRRQGTTLFMTVLGLFQVLLGRHAGSQDVVVGSPIAGRTRSELEPLVGFFVNTLALRADLSGSPSVSELLAQVREMALGAYAHQDIPFEKLVEELAPARHLGRTPLFQVMLTLQNTSAETLEMQGLRLEGFPLPAPPVKFDLTLTLSEAAGGVDGVLGYSADLFDATTTARLVERFGVLAEAAAADPERPVADLPLLPEAERHHLLREHNDTAAMAADETLHALFESQAARTPEAVAVVFEEQCLTYGELERRANRLARRLQGLGVGPETRVGLCLERSIELVVALLAAQKAGGAYVPLDPDLPGARLSYLVEDSAAAPVITESRFLELLPADGPCLLDRDWQAIVQQDDAPLGSMVSPDQSTYVLYTSGSTGRPKGVVVPHRGVVNHMRWIQRALSLQDWDRMLQKTPLVFDASVWELYAPLFAGATLVMARPGGHQDPAYLVEAVERHEITVFQGVPTLLSMLAEEPGFARCRSLRYLVSGGEVLSWELVERLRRRRDAAMFNLYGPTEASIDATGGRVPLAAEDSGRTVGLGRPLPNTRVHLLDRSLWPVPIGGVGEVCLGGLGLARGYLGRPELTAERFVPDPWSEGERLYRTGDLARRRADGDLEYLGRADSQVKLRGQRIELAEIESVLAGRPEVREAVVVVREDHRGDRRLVAYVTPVEGAPEPQALRGALRGQLPEYMVPAAFVVLDALPLLPNGKVDRRALPEPETVPETAGAAPRTPVEELLAGIWAEVLGRDRVGVEDNFFELGGHSLLATQVVSRVRSVLGASVPLRALFETPTVAGLARQIEQLERGASAQPIPPADRSGPLPLSFAQERLWFIDRLEPNSTAYHMPVRFRLAGDLDVAALERSLREIVRRHESLRTTFLEIDGEPRQVISQDAGPSLPVVDLQSLPVGRREAEARRLARDEAARPFDLARGPLLRACLLRREEREWTALFNLHHIVGDGWSFGVLVGELTAIYPASLHAPRSPLPELAVQYADFAVWQRRWLCGEVLEEQLAWWRQELAGAPTLLELPTDRPRPAIQGSHGASVSCELPAGLAPRLAALSREAGATLFMVLSAAFQVVLHRWAGYPEDVLLATAVANRNRAELERLIGFFVNTLVLRGRLGGAPTFRQLLARVRESALGAYAHQDLPFEKLVNETHIERSLSYNPLAQVMLVLQNAPVGTLELPGLTLSPEEAPVTTAKFDLELSLSEVRGRIVGTLGYATSLFDAPTVLRLLEHYRNLLQGVVDSPELPVSDLPLLSGAERHQLLREWNATAEVEAWGTLPELFAAQAARVPDGIALDFESEAVSYGELARRARLLGRSLRRLGVGPETRVGLFLERSVEMVVGVLGTLVSGGAYVPLDPSYPQERLSFMLQDAQVPVLVTQQHLEPSLPESAARVVRLDADWERISREPERDSPGDLALANVVYVIYTSGSTGRPKGVLVTHRGLCNLVQEQTRSFALGPGDRVLQFHSLSFDMSIWDIVVALGVGATLVLAPRERLLPGSPLAELLLERQVTQATLLPSVLASLPAEELLALHTVMSGAEPCPLELARRWSPGRTFFNGYGPTEATIELIQWVYDGQERRPPIGRPIRNARAYVVDAHQQPVPVGVAGELCLGGAPLARGYLGRPETTAEKFIPDGFGDEPGARLYRTGDLVRQWPDGNLDFLGRIDSQVKVRGYRIELGEIESVLKGHAGVGEAVVVVREDRTGDRRLAAYVVPREGAAPSTGELREHVGAKLPEHMVPSAFMILDALPLAPNHKVDRRALAKMELDWQEVALSHLAPRDLLELELAGLWQQTLGIARIGVRDDFFALGGHSLLAVKLLAAIKRRFGRELPLSILFRQGTIEGLAESLRREEPEPAASCLVPIQPGGTATPFFCVHGVGGDVLGFAALAGHLGPDQPFYALRSRGLAGDGEPLASIEDMAALYLEEIRRVQPVGPYRIGGWSLGGVVSVEMACQLCERGEQVELIALLDSSPGIVGGGRGEEAASDIDILLAIASYVEGLWGGTVGLTPEDLLAVAPEARPGRLLERLQAMDLLSPGTGEEHLLRVMQVYEANLRAVRAYTLRPYPGKLVLFKAGEPVSAGEVDRGWSRALSCPVEVHSVPGGHLTLLTEPYVSDLAKHLQDCMKEDLLDVQCLC